MNPHRSLLGHHMEDFQNLKESLGFSRNTHSFYLQEIDDCLALHYPKLDSLTEEFTLEWIQKRPTECKNTQKRRMVTLREFGKYLNTIGVPSYTLPSYYIGKYTRSTPYLFSDEELTRLFSTFDHIAPYWKTPERKYIIPVLFRMMYCCGLRPAEPLALLRGDVDVDSGILFIRNSKGHKDRIVRMSQDLVELCSRFDKKMGERTWFFSFQGSNRPCQSLWVRKILVACWGKSGLDHGQKKPVPYSFRHNFATRIILNWLKDGLPFEVMMPFLCEYMGHSEFASTLYYINLLPENIVRNSEIDWDRLNTIYPEVNDEADR
ncbi:MAG: tyrosine-type recombinase/integrase [Lentisphaerota bacterium]